MIRLSLSVLIVFTLAVMEAEGSLRRSARLLAKTTAFPEIDLSSEAESSVVRNALDVEVLGRPVDENLDEGEIITDPITLPISRTPVNNIPGQVSAKTKSPVNIVSVSAVIAVLLSLGFALRATLMH